MSTAAAEPAISVVVPVYDAAEYLATCVEALLAQSFADFEIVAVDDGSRDASPAMLAGYAARDARVRVLTQANGGPSIARNAGLRAARGGYVWFVDADDLVVPDGLRMLADVVAQHPVDVVTFNAEAFGDGDAMPLYRQPKPAGVVSGETWIEQAVAQREFPHYPWLALYRREFLVRNELAFVAGIVHEDVVWCTECLARAASVVYVDRVLYRYRRHAASLTGGRDDARLMRRIDSYFLVVERLRAINERAPLGAAAKRSLQAEIVGQALQVDRLAASLADPARRAEVRARCRDTRFWERLWPEATSAKRKRQLLKVMLRQRLGLP